jgi:phage tail sheath protein FI
MRDDVVGVKPAIAIDNLVTYITVDFNIGDPIGKYNAFFGNYKYQYSTELDEYMWVNVAGDVAGIRAAMNTAKNTWDASAGLDYGALKNCIKLAINPNQAQRDILYKNMVNPIVSFNGQGTVVWGQKTLQSKPSAFDRINVRGLFNEMERAISKMAKYYVFTNNDAYTRSRFKSTIEPYLRNIKANRGIFDYYVRCDETNNTAYVVDSNQFIADIAIKPTRTAEFLVLNFIAVGTGVDFKEIFA